MNKLRRLLNSIKYRNTHYFTNQYEVKRKGKTKWLISGCMLGFTIFGAFIWVYNNSQVKANEIQAGIASELIRFHVIANSDTEADQELKYLVRDAVIDHMQVLLDTSSSIDETRAILIEKMDEMKLIAMKVLEDNDSNDDIVISLTNQPFPTKVYGDIVLPTGVYEALRIEIGDAKGENWWCVMFPPLCFVDVTHGVVPDKSKESLKNVLTEDEYNRIVFGKQEKKPVKIKFKLFELYKESTFMSDKAKTTLVNFSNK